MGNLRSLLPAFSLALGSIACGPHRSGEDDPHVSSGPASSSTGSGTDESAANASTDPGEPGTSTGSTSSTSSPDGPIFDVGSLDVGSGPVGCAPDSASFIYLLDIDGAIHRLNPDDMSTTLLGEPNCAGADLAMALTLDRSGALWAMMVDQEGYRLLFTIDPDTLACSPVDVPFPDDFLGGGLAFVADTPGSEAETLYIGNAAALDGSAPLQLLAVDLETLALNLRGTLPLVPNGGPQIADLVGTGDSRLFGFFSGDAYIVEIDEETVEKASEQPAGITVGSPWAITQWEGSLWLFGNASGGSEVHEFHPATGQVEMLSPNIGVSVVGAGVSTCAPFEPEG